MQKITEIYLKNENVKVRKMRKLLLLIFLFTVFTVHYLCVFV